MVINGYFTLAILYISADMFSSFISPQTHKSLLLEILSFSLIFQKSSYDEQN